MSHLAQLYKYISHLDQYLQNLIEQHRILVYVIIFGIVFLETGFFLLAPVLPSDTLVFAAGTFASFGSLNINILLPGFYLAALAGDQTNYLLGKLIGSSIFSGRFHLLKPSYLEYTHSFYTKYGGITVFYGRFVPVVRALVPFVAGSGSMMYIRFLKFSSVGVLMWVLLYSAGGYLLGSIQFVKRHPELVIAGLAVIAIIPAIVQFAIIRMRKAGI